MEVIYASHWSRRARNSRMMSRVDEAEYILLDVCRESTVTEPMRREKFKNTVVCNHGRPTSM